MSRLSISVATLSNSVPRLSVSVTSVAALYYCYSCSIREATLSISVHRLKLECSNTVY